MDETTSDVFGLTAEVVSAHVSNNAISSADVPALIQSVFRALTQTASSASVEERREPAVLVRSSIKQDSIVCLEDRAKLKMVKRYLRTTYDMSCEDYRAKCNLPQDYPMVTPAYTDLRKQLARNIGLGSKRAAQKANFVPTASDDTPVAKERDRPMKSSEPSRPELRGGGAVRVGNTVTKPARHVRGADV